MYKIDVVKIYLYRIAVDERIVNFKEKKQDLITEKTNLLSASKADLTFKMEKSDFLSYEKIKHFN